MGANLSLSDEERERYTQFGRDSFHAALRQRDSRRVSGRLADRLRYSDVELLRLPDEARETLSLRSVPVLAALDDDGDGLVSEEDVVAFVDLLCSCVGSTGRHERPARMRAVCARVLAGKLRQPRGFAQWVRRLAAEGSRGPLAPAGQSAALEETLTPHSATKMARKPKLMHREVVTGPLYRLLETCGIDEMVDRVTFFHYLQEASEKMGLLPLDDDGYDDFVAVAAVDSLLESFAQGYRKLAETMMVV